MVQCKSEDGLELDPWIKQVFSFIGWSTPTAAEHHVDHKVLSEHHVDHKVLSSVSFYS